MTIKRGAFADWRVTCNSCESVEVYPNSISFTSLTVTLQKLKWKAYKLYEVWRHRCPSCEATKAAAKLERVVDRERLHA